MDPRRDGVHGLWKHERALGVLEQMGEAGLRSLNPGTFTTSPVFDPLHNDPRFIRLKEKVGFP